MPCDKLHLHLEANVKHTLNLKPRLLRSYKHTKQKRKLSIHRVRPLTVVPSGVNTGQVTNQHKANKITHNQHSHTQ